ncbi:MULTISPECIES: TRAP transporter permease [Thalassospira]|uniref:TRAP transporter fused permease subunit n=1 Tax=Thalassospira aquimaris TaxID=3037796 RepID=A0ABT6G795_9PROT|nr:MULTISPECIES: TRAP transporter fused permease subunit [Thalassospira]MDG4717922.1 TRAP transporter fused permease subunit [Thalassospira sp. FZY0004]
MPNQSAGNYLAKEERLERRSSHRLVVMLFAIAALTTSAVHIYFNSFGLISELRFAAIHFGTFGFLCALTYPLSQSHADQTPWIVFDVLIGCVALFCGIYFLFNDVAYWDRGGKMTNMDWAVAFTSVLVALELLRRTMGWFIPILIVIALSYAAFWGEHISGIFRFPGISFEEVLARSYFVDLGLFGDIAQISMTYVFMFVMFGAFLVKSGAAEFIIDLSRAVARRAIGGSGMVAVFGSALMGSISGAAVANIVTTGVVTIPLMKKSGYKPTFAAGVETAASTGGALLPPIMGAGAFIMASYTQISYMTIAAMALLPALLYFASVMYYVRMEAIRLDLTEFEDEEARSLMQVLREGGISLLPIALLVALLIYGFSATYCAAASIIATVVCSWLSPRHRMGLRDIYEAVIMGARNAIPTSILLVSIGLLIGVMGTTGFGPTFSLMIIEWAGGSLMIMLALITMVSLVLGMGLPVTAAYIVLATISAPSLADLITTNNVVDILVSGDIPQEVLMLFQLVDPELPAKIAAGLSADQAFDMITALPIEMRAALRPMMLDQELLVTSLLSAHMILFWVSQDSNVTPPVCLPAFVAAAIAKSPPMRTGFAAFRMCKGLYIIPLLFAYTPLLGGNWNEMLVIFGTALVGLHALTGAMTGVIETRIGIVGRLVAALFGAVLLWPMPIEYKVLPLALYVSYVVFDWLRRRRLAQSPSPVAVSSTGAETTGKA